jgi:hypothetical protein
VAQVRSFDNHCLFDIENVFVAKQEDPASAARELAIEERIVIGTPTDLRDVEIPRNAHVRTHSFQLRSFDSPVLQAEPDLIQST